MLTNSRLLIFLQKVSEVASGYYMSLTKHNSPILPGLYTRNVCGENEATVAKHQSINCRQMIPLVQPLNYNPAVCLGSKSVCLRCFF